MKKQFMVLGTHHILHTLTCHFDQTRLLTQTPGRMQLDNLPILFYSFHLAARLVSKPVAVKRSPTPTRRNHGAPR